jgi:ATP-binding cassette subfamily B protein RaxB
LSAVNYRRSIGGVLQNDGLFAGSIAENVAGFDDSPNLPFVEDCAAQAAILDDIRRMPMG